MLALYSGELSGSQSNRFNEVQGTSGVYCDTVMLSSRRGGHLSIPHVMRDRLRGAAEGITMATPASLMMNKQLPITHESSELAGNGPHRFVFAQPVSSEPPVLATGQAVR